MAATRLTPAERTAVDEAAKAAGVSTSDLIRDALVAQLGLERPKTRTGPRSASPRAAQRSMSPSAKNGGGR